MPKTLYICYFGLREPLVQTQVIPYLREIMKDNVQVSLLTFEQETIGKVEEQKLISELAATGIEWNWLSYHKRPSALATAYDICRGALFVRRMIGRQPIDILHCRVHVPALMGALGRKFSRRKPKLLFDIRGFFPEEYTDAGIWPEGGWLYRSAKRVERWLLEESDGFVVLTEKARTILFPESSETGMDKLGRPVEVIPCCVDIKRFTAHASQAEARRKLGVEDRFVAVYVGSFGGWYLTDEMMKFFAVAREFRRDTFVLILTQRDKERIVARLRELGLSDSDFLVESAKPSEIGGYLAAADVALSFIKACYSKLSSSPTKIAEYLGSGLPIIANGGVGDVDQLINENQVGVLTREFSPDAYREALSNLEHLGNIKDRCFETAKREFDLEAIGGTRYRRIYKRLLA